MLNMREFPYRQIIQFLLNKKTFEEAQFRLVKIQWTLHPHKRGPDDIQTQMFNDYLILNHFNFYKLACIGMERVLSKF